MRYLELPPTPALASLVECIWLLSDDGDAMPATPQRIVPDGCVEIVVNLGRPMRRLHESGASELQPLRIAVGQTERHVTIAPTGAVDLLGIRFHPAGARPVLRHSTAELTGRIEALGAVAPALDAALERGLASARTPAERVAVVESALLERVSGQPAVDPRVRVAVDRLLARDGCLRISGLARDLGTSTRQLERRFEREVGLGPKRLARILRFQSVFRAAGSGVVSGWAAVALECGYHDQAHLTREFKDFAGVTPPPFFARDEVLARLFSRRDRMSHSYKTEDARLSIVRGSTATGSRSPGGST
jgi:AraC-like DNA-binding protein